MSSAEADAVMALSQVKTPAQRRVGGRMYTVLLMVVFFVVLLVALVAGVQVYRNAAQIQSLTQYHRTSGGLLANSIHANDATYSVAVGTGPEGRSLVLLDTTTTEDTTYETRIYLYQGYVMQEYALRGTEYDPALAQQLAPSNTFDFSYRDGLLTIQTDSGATQVALRSWQGGN